MIRNISFDLWLTLIKSNPKFKPKRAELIAQEYNPFNLNVGTIEQEIRNIDKLFDRFNESRECKLDTKLMYKRILEKTGFNKDEIEENLLIELKKKVDDLFLTYPPLPLHREISSILQELKEKGYKLNIASNTGFIEGSILMEVFRNLNWYQLFDFYIYSDEIQTSKPAYSFFQSVYNKMHGINKESVVHIGDNPKTDFEGAKQFGFQALLIDRNYTINTINNFLNEVG